jgi:hypothetical protein
MPKGDAFYAWEYLISSLLIGSSEQVKWVAKQWVFSNSFTTNSSVLEGNYENYEEGKEEIFCEYSAKFSCKECAAIDNRYLRLMYYYCEGSYRKIDANEYSYLRSVEMLWSGARIQKNFRRLRMCRLFCALKSEFGIIRFSDGDRRKQALIYCDYGSSVFVEKFYAVVEVNIDLSSLIRRNIYPPAWGIECIEERGE